jgi:hypothetical protein
VAGSISTLQQRQNEPAMLALLRATSVLHTRTQRLEGLRLLASALVAGLGLAATLVPGTASAVTVIGGVWALAYAVGLGSWASRDLRRAATVQEMFDTRLYGLPWNEVAAAEPISTPEISRLARQYRGSDDRLLDYYDIPRLPRPFDILGCQQQNLGWGARVRRRYAQSVVAALGAWSCVGLVVGLIAGLDVGELLLRWYIPSLGALLLGVDLYRGQRDVAAERDRVLAVVRARINAVTRQSRDREFEVALLVLARQVQDVILQTRRRYTRIPAWLYTRFRLRDRSDFVAAMLEFEAEVRG